MPNRKYFAFTPEQLTEKTARELALELIKAKIWCSILTQSGKYRGLKVGLANPKEGVYVKGLIKLYKEANKRLKQAEPVSQSVTSDKDQLHLLFPDN